MVCTCVWVCVCALVCVRVHPTTAIFPTCLCSRIFWPQRPRTKTYPNSHRNQKNQHAAKMIRGSDRKRIEYEIVFMMCFVYMCSNIYIYIFDACVYIYITERQKGELRGCLQNRPYKNNMALRRERILVKDSVSTLRKHTDH